MYKWLVDEMATVSTRKFYVIDGAAPTNLQETIGGSNLPPSYKNFVLQFGNAKLYRQRSVYLVQVLAPPITAQSEEGETLLHFGRTDMSLAYFKESLLILGRESPVFEWRHEQGLQNTANSFEEWLEATCSAARQLFKRKDWEDILKGPSPFSEQEQSVVEARSRFRWRVVGVAPNGDLRFEVHNGSNLTLPYLTIGIRGKLRPPKEGPLNGGVWLPVSSISPGETRVIEKDCYKDAVDPNDVEAFEKASPEPEDRDRYWEFKGLKSFRN